MILINSISIITKKCEKNYNYKWFYATWNYRLIKKKKKEYLNNNLITANIKIKIKIKESLLVYISRTEIYK